MAFKSGNSLSGYVPLREVHRELVIESFVIGFAANAKLEPAPRLWYASTFSGFTY